MTGSPIYQAPFDEFAAARAAAKKALYAVTFKHKFQDAAIIPAVLYVAAELAALSESTDDEIVDQFKKCLFDVRTKNTQENPQ